MTEASRKYGDRTRSICAGISPSRGSTPGAMTRFSDPARAATAGGGVRPAS